MVIKIIKKKQWNQEYPHWVKNGYWYDVTILPRLYNVIFENFYVTSRKGTNDLIYKLDVYDKQKDQSSVSIIIKGERHLSKTFSKMSLKLIGEKSTSLSHEQDPKKQTISGVETIMKELIKNSSIKFQSPSLNNIQTISIKMTNFLVRHWRYVVCWPPSESTATTQKSTFNKMM